MTTCDFNPLTFGEMAPVSQHCELDAAAVDPEHVVVCDTDGCMVVHANAVDPDKVSLDCTTGDCVLVPDPVFGHEDSCPTRSDGYCYRCDAG